MGPPVAAAPLGKLGLFSAMVGSEKVPAEAEATVPDELHDLLALLTTP